MSGRSIGPVLINGEEFAPADAAVSIFDIGFQRGYGCFEAMRTYDGSVFRLAHHLDRLEQSASNLRIGLPPREELEAWGVRVGSGGDGVLRVCVTGGPGVARAALASRKMPAKMRERRKMIELGKDLNQSGRGWSVADSESSPFQPHIESLLWIWQVRTGMIILVLDAFWALLLL